MRLVLSTDSISHKVFKRVKRICQILLNRASGTLLFESGIMEAKSLRAGKSFATNERINETQPECWGQGRTQGLSVCFESTMNCKPRTGVAGTCLS